MFWNNASFPRTVKFKLAFYYTCLFGISALVCFAAIYVYQTDHIYDDVDKKLISFKNNFEYEYITGREPENTEHRIAEDDIPAHIQSEISKLSPAFKFLFATLDHGNIISVFGAENGHPVVFAEAKSYGTLRKQNFEFNRLEKIKHQYSRINQIKTIDPLWIWLLDSGKNVLAHSGTGEDFVPALKGGEAESLQSGDRWEVAWHGQNQMRIFKHRLFDGNTLVLAYNMEDLKNSHTRLLSVFVVGLICMLGIGICSALLLANKFTGGLVRVTRAAREIEAGDFSSRVEHGKEGLELDNLIDAFNDMTENTEKLFRDLRTISDDIAHDLRTPLTRMRGQAELAVLSGSKEKLAGIVAEECSQMLIMINTMLDITQTECKIDREQFEPVDICALGGNIIELFSSIAEDKGVSLHAVIPPEALMIQGVKIKLQQLCINLLDNAVKFTPTGGSVFFTISESKHAVRLSVKDSGVGISTEDQKHIFDRFFRSDSSRALPGNGLGLALAKAIVTAHGGTIKVISKENEGTEFIITFFAS